MPPRARPRIKCGVVLEDGLPCNRTPAAGNPPMCADCIQDGQEIGGMEMIENLSERAHGILDRFAGAIDKISTVYQRAKDRMPQRAPAPAPRPAPGPARAGQPPNPSYRPPPPPRARPDEQAQIQAALRLFGWSSTTKWTADMVKKRWQALSLVYHPDPIQGAGAAPDDAMIQRINAAKGILLKHLKT